MKKQVEDSTPTTVITTMELMQLISKINYLKAKCEALEEGLNYWKKKVMEREG